MRVLGIITARGGSKGVPGKNIKPLCGKPLLGYTVEAALDSKRLTRLILSTDDPAIAEVGRSFGADVPFLRPQELSGDTVPTLPVILHAVEFLENAGETYDAVCLLQPTNPLRRAEDIDGCIHLIQQRNADSVVTVLPVPDSYNPKWVYWSDPHGGLSLSTGETEPVPRRQDLPKAVHREGSVYVTRRNVLSDYGNLYGKDIVGYEIDVRNSINIDTMEDWVNAERIICGRENGQHGTAGSVEPGEL